MSDDPKEVARELAEAIDHLTAEQARKLADQETEAIEENIRRLRADE